MRRVLAAWLQASGDPSPDDRRPRRERDKETGVLLLHCKQFARLACLAGPAASRDVGAEGGREIAAEQNAWPLEEGRRPFAAFDSADELLLLCRAILGAFASSSPCAASASPPSAPSPASSVSSPSEPRRSLLPSQSLFAIAPLDACAGLLLNATRRPSLRSDAAAARAGGKATGGARPRPHAEENAGTSQTGTELPAGEASPLTDANARSMQQRATELLSLACQLQAHVARALEAWVRERRRGAEGRACDTQRAAPDGEGDRGEVQRETLAMCRVDAFVCALAWKLSPCLRQAASGLSPPSSAASPRRLRDCQRVAAATLTHHMEFLLLSLAAPSPSVPVTLSPCENAALSGSASHCSLSSLPPSSVSASPSRRASPSASFRKDVVSFGEELAEFSFAVERAAGEGLQLTLALPQTRPTPHMGGAGSRGTATEAGELAAVSLEDVAEIVVPTVRALLVSARTLFVLHEALQADAPAPPDASPPVLPASAAAASQAFLAASSAVPRTPPMPALCDREEAPRLDARLAQLIKLVVLGSRRAVAARGFLASRALAAMLSVERDAAGRRAAVHAAPCGERRAAKTLTEARTGGSETDGDGTRGTGKRGGRGEAAAAESESAAPFSFFEGGAALKAAFALLRAFARRGIATALAGATRDPPQRQSRDAKAKRQTSIQPVSENVATDAKHPEAAAESDAEEERRDTLQKERKAIQKLGSPWSLLARVLRGAAHACAAALRPLPPRPRQSLDSPRLRAAVAASASPPAVSLWSLSVASALPSFATPPSVASGSLASGFALEGVSSNEAVDASSSRVAVASYSDVADGALPLAEVVFSQFCRELIAEARSRFARAKQVRLFAVFLSEALLPPLRLLLAAPPLSVATQIPSPRAFSSLDRRCPVSATPPARGENGKQVGDADSLTKEFDAAKRRNETPFCALATGGGAECGVKARAAKRETEAESATHNDGEKTTPSNARLLSASTRSVSTNRPAGTDRPLGQEAETMLKRRDSLKWECQFDAERLARVPADEEGFDMLRTPLRSQSPLLMRRRYGESLRRTPRGTSDDDGEEAYESASSLSRLLADSGARSASSPFASASPLLDSCRREPQPRAQRKCSGEAADRKATWSDDAASSLSEFSLESPPSLASSPLSSLSRRASPLSAHASEALPSGVAAAGAPAPHSPASPATSSPRSPPSPLLSAGRFPASSLAANSAYPFSSSPFSLSRGRSVIGMRDTPTKVARRGRALSLLSQQRVSAVASPLSSLSRRLASSDASPPSAAVARPPTAAASLASCAPSSGGCPKPAGAPAEPTHQPVLESRSLALVAAVMKTPQRSRRQRDRRARDPEGDRGESESEGAAPKGESGASDRAYARERAPEERTARGVEGPISTSQLRDLCAKAEPVPAEPEGLEKEIKERAAGHAETHSLSVDSARDSRPPASVPLDSFASSTVAVAAGAPHAGETLAPHLEVFVFALKALQESLLFVKDLAGGAAVAALLLNELYEHCAPPLVQTLCLHLGSHANRRKLEGIAAPWAVGHPQTSGDPSEGADPWSAAGEAACERLLRAAGSSARGGGGEARARSSADDREETEERASCAKGDGRWCVIVEEIRGVIRRGLRANIQARVSQNAGMPPRVSSAETLASLGRESLAKGSCPSIPAASSPSSGSLFSPSVPPSPWAWLAASTAPFVDFFPVPLALHSVLDVCEPPANATTTDAAYEAKGIQRGSLSRLAFVAAWLEETLLLFTAPTPMHAPLHQRLFTPLPSSAPSPSSGLSPCAPSLWVTATSSLLQGLQRLSVAVHIALTPRLKAVGAAESHVASPETAKHSGQAAVRTSAVYLATTQQISTRGATDAAEQDCLFWSLQLCASVYETAAQFHLLLRASWAAAKAKEARLEQAEGEQRRRAALAQLAAAERAAGETETPPEATKQPAPSDVKEATHGRGSRIPDAEEKGNKSSPACASGGSDDAHTRPTRDGDVAVDSESRRQRKKAEAKKRLTQFILSATAGNGTTAFRALQVVRKVLLLASQFLSSFALPGSGVTKPHPSPAGPAAAEPASRAAPTPPLHSLATSSSSHLSSSSFPSSSDPLSFPPCDSSLPADLRQPAGPFAPREVARREQRAGIRFLLAETSLLLSSVLLCGWSVDVRNESDSEGRLRSREAGESGAQVRGGCERGVKDEDDETAFSCALSSPSRALPLSSEALSGSSLSSPASVALPLDREDAANRGLRLAWWRQALGRQAAARRHVRASLASFLSFLRSLPVSLDSCAGHQPREACGSRLAVLLQGDTTATVTGTGSKEETGRLQGLWLAAAPSVAAPSRRALRPSGAALSPSSGAQLPSAPPLSPPWVSLPRPVTNSSAALPPPPLAEALAVVQAVAGCLRRRRGAADRLLAPGDWRRFQCFATLLSGDEAERWQSQAPQTCGETDGRRPSAAGARAESHVGLREASLAASEESKGGDGPSGAMRPLLEFLSQLFWLSEACGAQRTGTSSLLLALALLLPAAQLPASAAAHESLSQASATLQAGGRDGHFAWLAGSSQELREEGRQGGQGSRGEAEVGAAKGEADAEEGGGAGRRAEPAGLARFVERSAASAACLVGVSPTAQFPSPYVSPSADALLALAAVALRLALRTPTGAPASRAATGDGAEASHSGEPQEEAAAHASSATDALAEAGHTRRLGGGAGDVEEEACGEAPNAADVAFASSPSRLLSSPAARGWCALAESLLRRWEEGLLASGARSSRARLALSTSSAMVRFRSAPRGLAASSAGQIEPWASPLAVVFMGKASVAGLRLRACRRLLAGHERRRKTEDVVSDLFASLRRLEGVETAVKPPEQTPDTAFLRETSNTPSTGAATETHAPSSSASSAGARPAASPLEPAGSPSSLASWLDSPPSSAGPAGDLAPLLFTPSLPAAAVSALLEELSRAALDCGVELSPRPAVSRVSGFLAAPRKGVRRAARACSADSPSPTASAGAKRTEGAPEGLWSPAEPDGAGPPCAGLSQGLGLLLSDACVAPLVSALHAALAASSCSMSFRCGKRGGATQAALLCVSREGSCMPLSSLFLTGAQGPPLERTHCLSADRDPPSSASKSPASPLASSHRSSSGCACGGPRPLFFSASPHYAIHPSPAVAAPSLGAPASLAVASGAFGLPSLLQLVSSQLCAADAHDRAGIELYALRALAGALDVCCRWSFCLSLAVRCAAGLVRLVLRHGHPRLDVSDFSSSSSGSSLSFLSYVSPVPPALASEDSLERSQLSLLGADPSRSLLSATLLSTSLSDSRTSSSPSLASSPPRETEAAAPGGRDTRTHGQSTQAKPDRESDFGGGLRVRGEDADAVAASERGAPAHALSLLFRPSSVPLVSGLSLGEHLQLKALLQALLLALKTLFLAAASSGRPQGTRHAIPFESLPFRRSHAGLPAAPGDEGRVFASGLCEMSRLACETSPKLSARSRATALASSPSSRASSDPAPSRRAPRRTERESARQVPARGAGVVSLSRECLGRLATAAEKMRDVKTRWLSSALSLYDRAVLGEALTEALVACGEASPSYAAGETTSPSSNRHGTPQANARAASADQTGWDLAGGERDPLPRAPSRGKAGAAGLFSSASFAASSQGRRDRASGVTTESDKGLAENGNEGVATSEAAALLPLYAPQPSAHLQLHPRFLLDADVLRSFLSRLVASPQEDAGADTLPTDAEVEDETDEEGAEAEKEEEEGEEEGEREEGLDRALRALALTGAWGLGVRSDGSRPSRNPELVHCTAEPRRRDQEEDVSADEKTDLSPQGKPLGASDLHKKARSAGDDVCNSCSVTARRKRLSRTHLDVALWVCRHLTLPSFVSWFFSGQAPSASGVSPLNSPSASPPYSSSGAGASSRRRLPPATRLELLRLGVEIFAELSLLSSSRLVADSRWRTSLGSSSSPSYHVLELLRRILALACAERDAAFARRELPTRETETLHKLHEASEGDEGPQGFRRSLVASLKFLLSLFCLSGAVRLTDALALREAARIFVSSLNEMTEAPVSERRAREDGDEMCDNAQPSVGDERGNGGAQDAQARRLVSRLLRAAITLSCGGQAVSLQLLHRAEERLLLALLSDSPELSSSSPGLEPSSRSPGASLSPGASSVRSQTSMPHGGLKLGGATAQETPDERTNVACAASSSSLAFISILLRRVLPARRAPTRGSVPHSPCGESVSRAAPSATRGAPLRQEWEVGGLVCGSGDAEGKRASDSSFSLGSSVASSLGDVVEACLLPAWPGSVDAFFSSCSLPSPQPVSAALARRTVANGRGASCPPPSPRDAGLLPSCGGGHSGAPSESVLHGSSRPYFSSNSSSFFSGLMPPPWSCAFLSLSPDQSAFVVSRPVPAPLVAAVVAGAETVLATTEATGRHATGDADGTRREGSRAALGGLEARTQELHASGTERPPRRPRHHRGTGKKATAREEAACGEETSHHAAAAAEYDEEKDLWLTYWMREEDCLAFRAAPQTKTVSSVLKVDSCLPCSSASAGASQSRSVALLLQEFQWLQWTLSLTAGQTTQTALLRTSSPSSPSPPSWSPSSSFSSLASPGDGTARRSEMLKQWWRRRRELEDEFAALVQRLHARLGFASLLLRGWPSFSSTVSPPPGGSTCVPLPSSSASPAFSFACEGERKVDALAAALRAGGRVVAAWLVAWAVACDDEEAARLPEAQRDAQASEPAKRSSRAEQARTGVPREACAGDEDASDAETVVLGDEPPSPSRAEKAPVPASPFERLLEAARARGRVWPPVLRPLRRTSAPRALSNKKAALASRSGEDDSEASSGNAQQDKSDACVLVALVQLAYALASLKLRVVCRKEEKQMLLSSLAPSHTTHPDGSLSFPASVSPPRCLPSSRGCGLASAPPAASSVAALSPLPRQVSPADGDRGGGPWGGSDALGASSGSESPPDNAAMEAEFAAPSGGLTCGEGQAAAMQGGGGEMGVSASLTALFRREMLHIEGDTFSFSLDDLADFLRRHLLQPVAVPRSRRERRAKAPTAEYPSGGRGRGRLAAGSRGGCGSEEEEPRGNEEREAVEHTWRVVAFSFLHHVVRPFAKHFFRSSPSARPARPSSPSPEGSSVSSFSGRGSSSRRPSPSPRGRGDSSLRAEPQQLDLPSRGESEKEDAGAALHHSHGGAGGEEERQGAPSRASRWRRGWPRPIGTSPYTRVCEEMGDGRQTPRQPEGLERGDAQSQAADNGHEVTPSFMAFPSGKRLRGRSPYFIKGSPRTAEARRMSLPSLQSVLAQRAGASQMEAEDTAHGGGERGGSDSSEGLACLTAGGAGGLTGEWRDEEPGATAQGDEPNSHDARGQGGDTLNPDAHDSGFDAEYLVGTEPVLLYADQWFSQFPLEALPPLRLQPLCRAGGSPLVTFFLLSELFKRQSLRSAPHTRPPSPPASPETALRSPQHHPLAPPPSVPRAPEADRRASSTPSVRLPASASGLCKTSPVGSFLSSAPLSAERPRGGGGGCKRAAAQRGPPGALLRPRGTFRGDARGQAREAETAQETHAAPSLLARRDEACRRSQQWRAERRAQRCVSLVWDDGERQGADGASRPAATGVEDSRTRGGHDAYTKLAVCVFGLELRPYAKPCCPLARARKARNADGTQPKRRGQSVQERLEISIARDERREVAVNDGPELLRTKYRRADARCLSCGTSAKHLRENAGSGEAGAENEHRRAAQPVEVSAAERRTFTLRLSVPGALLGANKSRVAFSVNPSGDLPRTARICAPFLAAGGDAWTGRIGAPLTEEEWLYALLTADVFLYCGHQGGEQFINRDLIQRAFLLLGPGAHARPLPSLAASPSSSPACCASAASSASASSASVSVVSPSCDPATPPSSVLPAASGSAAASCSSSSLPCPVSPLSPLSPSSCASSPASAPLYMSSIQASALLFGCSSVRLASFSPQSEPWTSAFDFLVGGSPLVLGNLWSITDVEADAVTRSLLWKWTQACSSPIMSRTQRPHGAASGHVGAAGPEEESEENEGDTGDEEAQARQEVSASGLRRRAGLFGVEKRETPREGKSTSARELRRGPKSLDGRLQAGQSRRRGASTVSEAPRDRKRRREGDLAAAREEWRVERHAVETYERAASGAEGCGECPCSSLRLSLTEALTEAKQACRLRLSTGAAAVVFGLPL
ncbi:hypothetical protein BESB_001440 [Besnoitia besnoiti]|uniref:Peptidase C50 domain-containing protein n=1 Tax=Besnoitia besnoiti TaxID=94643 RepID=A0A2A9MPP1_BESBE|nr:hypothetical protein BESB_001440 [Besnoitia besnoiti]PFH37802.1 hypothetical protein BESB_001440 [Besnoitia besnoiti]